MAEKDFRVPVFRRAIRGYAPEHVDAFISAVQEKYYSLIAENEKLRARISEITAENKKRGVEEEMRRREIEEIGERAENLLREAKDRADRIVREAEAEADRIRADAACERKDAEIYAEEARAEALEMVKERDEMLVRTKEAVSDLREKLVEEYERVLRTLDEFDGVPAEKEETESEPVGEIGEDEQAFAGQEPEKAVAFADDVREYAVPDEIRPEEEQTDELPEDEITIPDFSPVFEEDGEEEEEDPERARKRETFPFAFDENDYYREDAAEESEEDEEDEGDQEEYYRGTYENGTEDETEEEADPEEEDLKFSEAIPDFISDYPDEEVAGVLEEEYEDTPEEEFEEVFEGEEQAEEEEETEEPEGTEEEPEEETDGIEEEAEGYVPEDADFASASSGTYRDYDLDEILKGLEYMTNGQAEEAVGSADVLPDDDAGIVDALKKKFGDVPDGDLPEEEEKGTGTGDFYEDEEHEDGESFDPNSFLRFRK